MNKEYWFTNSQPAPCSTFALAILFAISWTLFLAALHGTRSGLFSFAGWTEYLIGITPIIAINVLCTVSPCLIFSRLFLVLQKHVPWLAVSTV